MAKTSAEQNQSAAAGGNGRSTARRSALEQQVFRHASRLFAENGVASTSLQDIAESVGMSRPALYHYFASKEDLLERLIAEHPKRSAREFGAIRRRTDLGPEEQLAEMMRVLVHIVAEDPQRMRVLVNNETELTGELAEMHAKAKRKVLEEMRAVLDEGISAGVFRPVDARTAALGLLGMGHWTAWWLDSGDVDAVADQFADMGVRAVARTGDPAEAGLAGTINVLRQELDHLERQLRDESQLTD